MTKLDRPRAALAAAFTICGLLMALLPKTWLEQRLGVEPDAGSGLVELLLVAGPLALGLGLALSMAPRLGRRPATRTRPRDLG